MYMINRKAEKNKIVKEYNNGYTRKSKRSNKRRKIQQDEEKEEFIEIAEQQETKEFVEMGIPRLGNPRPWDSNDTDIFYGEDVAVENSFTETDSHCDEPALENDGVAIRELRDVFANLEQQQRCDKGYPIPEKINLSNTSVVTAPLDRQWMEKWGGSLVRNNASGDNLLLSYPSL